MKWIWLLLLGSFGSVGFAQDLEDLSYAELDSFMILEYGKGNYRKAITYVEMGKNKSRLEYGKNDSIYSRYINDLGVLFMELNEYKKAELLFIESKNIREIIFGRNHLYYTISVNNLAIIYHKTGKYKKSERLFLDIREIKKNLGRSKFIDYANVLNNLANLYMDMGLYYEAENLYLKSRDLNLSLLGRKNHRYTNSVCNLGNFYHRVHQYRKSERLYLEAKQIEAEILGNTHPKYALTLNHLATLYGDMDSFDLAESIYINARSIISNSLGEKHLDYAVVISNLAKLYSNQEKFEEAKNLYLKAIGIKAKILGNKNPIYAIELHNLGQLYIELQDFDKAKLFLIKSKTILINKLGTENPHYAASLIGLAKLYREIGILDSAFLYSMESIAANSPEIDRCDIECIEKINTFTFYSNNHINSSLNSLLKTLQKQFDKDKDILKLYLRYKIIDLAIKHNENMAHSLIDEDDKLRLIHSNGFFATRGIITASKLQKGVYNRKAFYFAEQNKSILLANAIKGSRARQFGDLPDTLIERELQLQKELNTLKKQEYTAKTEGGKINASRALGELHLIIDTFLKVLKDKYPKYHALKYENITAKAEEVQSLLDSETLLLECFQTERKVYLFTVSKDSIELFPIEIIDTLVNEKVGLLRRSLSDYFFILEDEDKAYQQYTETAHWFYKELLAVALKDKRIKNLIIIADGELGHLPFEAFLTESISSQKAYNDLPYLMNQYNVSYNYSATLWKENLKEKERISNGEMLACAATYEGSIDSSLWNTRLPYFFSLRGDSTLSPLFANKEEIRRLSNHFNGKFLIGQAANEQFFKQNASNYSIIHLAMHGLANIHTPMLSSLAFTEDGDSVENNFLQAYEISQMKLNADLVVLSACETGYGKFRQGEGIVSLARAFMYAGAPSLVVSLWQVNDASTAIIMQSFYGYLAEGKTKSAALRQAKLDYLKEAKGVKAHPAFWSAFIQLGNDAPIQLQQKSFVNRYIFEVMLGIILLAATLLSYCYQKRLRRKSL